MKKKLKDFAVDELTNLCPQTHCDDCPFRDSKTLCDFINAIGKVGAIMEADTEGSLGQLEDIEKVMAMY